MMNPFGEIKEVKEATDDGMKNKIKAFENAIREAYNKNTIENSVNEKDVSSEIEEAKNDSGKQNSPENLHQEKIDGETRYYDDNEKLYRVENNLEPNNEYEINGYKYTTDEQGRIVSVEGDLHMKNHEGRLPIKDSIEDIGKGDQKEGDDRGHLIGDQFDGSNGLENMIPQDSNVNRNDFKIFENELAKEVKDGKEVYISINVIYEEDSRRPEAIAVTYSIDGQVGSRIFHNGKEE